MPLYSDMPIFSHLCTQVPKQILKCLPYNFIFNENVSMIKSCRVKVNGFCRGQVYNLSCYLQDFKQLLYAIRALDQMISVFLSSPWDLCDDRQAFCACFFLQTRELLLNVGWSVSQLNLLICKNDIVSVLPHLNEFVTTQHVEVLYELKNTLQMRMVVLLPMA